MLDEGGYAAIIVFLTYVASVEFMVQPVLDAFARARERHPDRPIILSMVGSGETIAPYEALGVPVFEDLERAVRAVSALVRAAEGLACGAGAGTDADRCGKAGGRRIGGRFPEVQARSPEAGTATHLPGGRYTGDRLDEYEARRLLASWGVPVGPAHVARNAVEAAYAARTIGAPVAMKLLSPDVEHKTEAGGVVLGVAPGDAAGEYGAILARAKAYDAQAELRGVLISPMVRGVECILGVQRDPVFGPVVMVGSGGVLAEVLNDVAFRKVPIDHTQAQRMIAELAVAGVLEGIRGRPRCDVGALAAAAAALSRFAAAHADVIESVDVNPFVVLPEGEGAFALDALIVGRWGG